MDWPASSYPSVGGDSPRFFIRVPASPVSNEASLISLPDFNDGTPPPLISRLEFRDEAENQMYNFTNFAAKSRGDVDPDLEILKKNLDYAGASDRGGSPSLTAKELRHCGGNFEALAGIFLSPGWPLYYPNRAKCVYKIRVPSGHNYTVKLTCADFNTQGPTEGECQHDYLEVSGLNKDSGVNGTARFCGELPDLSATSEGEMMTVTFVSDKRFRYSGFKCRFRAMHPNGVATINSYLDTDLTNGHNLRRYDKNFFKVSSKR